MLSKDINQAVLDLLNNPNAKQHTPMGFPLLNIFPQFRDCFSEIAQQVLDNRHKGLVYEHNRIVMTPGLGLLLNKLGLYSCRTMQHGLTIRQFDHMNYIGSLCSKDTLYLAIEKVISVVNELMNKGFGKATLEPLSIIQIVPINKPEPEYIVLSYITLTQAGVTYATAKMPKMIMLEGTIPNRVEEQ